MAHQTLENFFLKHGRSFCFEAQAIIMARGSHTRIFYIRSGQVWLHSSSASGQEIGFRIHGPGAILGLSAIVDVKAIADFTALTSCELLRVERKTFDNELRSNPDFAVAVLNQTVKRLIESTKQAQDLALHKLTNRLASWLLSHMGEQGIAIGVGASVTIDLSQRVIAALSGVSRESVNRQLQQWVEAGIIETRGKDVRILDPDALCELAAEAR